MSALKRYRQSEKRHLRNKSYKSSINTSIKKIFTSIEGKDIDAARGYYDKSVALLDSAVNKGILHRKTSSRRISRLTRKFTSEIS